MPPKAFVPAALHEYLVAHGTPPDALQRELIEETRRATGGLSIMQIAPEQGAFMEILARAIGARRGIEVGTFTGYSSLCLARGLADDGRLVCCDVSEEWTAIARRYWKLARVERKIELRLAPALETLSALLAEGAAGRFDFAFIDADKRNYQRYFDRCLKLVRRGGLIAVDNTLWNGRVADRRAKDADTRAIRAFNRKLARDRRVEMAMVPIGDGLSLARKN